MAVCHCCQLEPVKRGTILLRALDMVNSVGSQWSQQVNATTDKQEKKKTPEC